MGGQKNAPCSSEYVLAFFRPAPPEGSLASFLREDETLESEGGRATSAAPSGIGGAGEFEEGIFPGSSLAFP